MSKYQTSCCKSNLERSTAPDEIRCKELLDNSLGLVTALNPHLGYEASTKIAKEALSSGVSIITLIKEQHLLTDEQLKQILQADKMTQPSY